VCEDKYKKTKKDLPLKPKKGHGHSKSTNRKKLFHREGVRGKGSVKSENTFQRGATVLKEERSEKKNKKQRPFPPKKKI